MSVRLYCGVTYDSSRASRAFQGTAECIVEQKALPTVSFYSFPTRACLLFSLLHSLCPTSNTPCSLNVRIRTKLSDKRRSLAIVSSRRCMELECIYRDITASSACRSPQTRMLPNLVVCWNHGQPKQFQRRKPSAYADSDTLLPAILPLPCLPSVIAPQSQQNGLSNMKSNA